jgi:hypothetical protein
VADGLVIWLLMQAFEDGQDMAIHAAELSVLESINLGHIEAAHSMGLTRL